MKNLSLILLFLTFSTYAQQTRQKMSVINFLDIPTVSQPRLSPNGSEVVYSFAESDWKQNKQVSHIRKTDATGTLNRQYTFGQNGEFSARWSPDGKWISFVSKRYEDSSNQIYLMPVNGGEAQQVSNHETAVSSVSWSANGQYIYFLASDAPSKEEKEAKKEKDDVYMYDENYKQRHLWRISVTDFKKQQVTSGNYSVVSFDLFNNEKILIQKSPTPLLDDLPERELWLLDFDGKNGKQLTNNHIPEGVAKISPDGNNILFVTGANKDFEFYYNSKLFILPSDGSETPIIPMPDWKYDISDAEWSKDGKEIYLLVNMGITQQLWSFTLKNQKLTQLTQGEFTIGSWHYQPAEDAHVMILTSETSPGEVYKLAKGKLTRLTSHYDYLKEQFELPTQKVITWKGKDGEQIEGLLYLPYGYKEGQKYPLVVQTHGGPAASDKMGFSRSFTRYVPVLTGKGYVVFQPNYRGSTGYGDDFMRDMVGSYFNQAHWDVMTGVDFLIEKGIADPEKMVKMGWSAGGHMTNKIITITNRFKAASSGAGAVNWVGMYAQSDVRIYRTPWFGGTPWQKDAPIDVYWENSPLKDISKVSTPTIVVVGESDPRVPLPQSLELYRALKSNKVPTHLYVAPREPHGWMELRHRLYKINVELEWFSKYALEIEYEWETVKEEGQ